MTKQFYLVTKNGLLDVASMLLEETCEAVLTGLTKLMDDSYGRMVSQPAQLAFVQRKDVESLNHETVMGFSRFFSRHDTEHAVIIQWTEDGELFPYLLGDGRLNVLRRGAGPDSKRARAGRAVTTLSASSQAMRRHPAGAGYSTYRSRRSPTARICSGLRRTSSRRYLTTTATSWSPCSNGRAESSPTG